MIKKIAWDTFKKTGSIDAFMELKQIENIEKQIQKVEKQNGNNENKRNNNS